MSPKSQAQTHIVVKSGIKDFVLNVHGQFVPGFHKPTALRCEPLRSQEQKGQQGRCPKALTDCYGVGGVAEMGLRSSEFRNPKATGAKASSLVARGGAGAMVDPGQKIITNWRQSTILSVESP
ncbi:hypothetical protein AK812_SmicGene31931 [Symbiodinium microadriaticum]|uniref:Uncharacterized protein n=1 Tax=Symbiodinium microadriaticum TaxID=2951 RepID=A0A1Q9CVG2_SYMMI|nr:hypothetical protein AK812_SmicGene31931 [Symbiodinium microadriaticum]